MSAPITLMILIIQFAIIFASSASSRSAFVGISTTSSCNTIQGAHNLMHHQLSIDHQCILLRRSSSQSIQYSSTSSRLNVKSLRDIIDNDGPPPPKSNSFNTLNNLQSPSTTTTNPNSSNSINTSTNTYKQLQITKLTNQIKNKSTSEIKKELEHTYRISTTDIRGKENLVKRLVDARLMSIKDDIDSVKNGKKIDSTSVDGAVSGVSAAKSSNSEQQSANHSTSNINSNSDINMNHGPDIKTMRIPEIKRELHLYGIKTDDFLEKRDLEDALLTERRLRMPPPPSVVIWRK